MTITKEKNITYFNNAFISICFAIKSWVAGLFFLMQAIYPDTFTCISVGIIKDMANELEIKTIESNHEEYIVQEVNTDSCSVNTSTKKLN